VTINKLAPKFMEGFPNTYTFSKALAESVVNDLCGNKIATIICRPTIVISTANDPMTGWIDNLNGPNGLTAAGGKGIVRSTYVDEDKKIDFMPVDCAIKGIIIATWMDRNAKETTVYNASSHDSIPMTQKQTKKICEQIKIDVPTLAIWYPSLFSTSNKFIHLLHVYLFQLVPSFWVDLLLMICNKKPILFSMQRKIFVVMKALEYFIVNEWSFLNDNLLQLDEFLLPEDIETFSMCLDDIDPPTFFIKAAAKGGELIFHEHKRNYGIYRAILNVLWVIHHVTRTAACIVILLLTYNYMLVPMTNKFYDYLLAL